MPSNNDGLSFKFSGNSFHTWQTRIKLILVKKSLWNIANGRDKKSLDAAQAAAWEVKDDKAQAIIKLELGTYIHHVDECTNAKDTWDVLNTLFGSQSKSSKFGLVIEFFLPDMKPQSSVASHYESMINSTCWH